MHKENGKTMKCYFTLCYNTAVSLYEAFPVMLDGGTEWIEIDLAVCRGCEIAFGKHTTIEHRDAHDLTPCLVSGRTITTS